MTRSCHGRDRNMTASHGAVKARTCSGETAVTERNGTSCLTTGEIDHLYAYLSPHPHPNHREPVDD